MIFFSNKVVILLSLITSSITLFIIFVTLLCITSNQNITLRFPSFDKGVQAWVQFTILLWFYIFLKLYFNCNEMSYYTTNHSICPSYNSKNMNTYNTEYINLSLSLSLYIYIYIYIYIFVHTKTLKVFFIKKTFLY